ncbi:MAG: four helix bundle protein [Crocinitomicaceae bacterium]|nr:four helix bundle protein [Crocinitomicaceae bacterium]
MHNFKELNIWKKSKDLSKDIFQMTSNFPSEHKFGLSSQLNRCAVSVPSNIAERSSRDSQKDFARFLQISLGSAFELETQLIIAGEIELINSKELENLLERTTEIQRMIHGFKSKL